MQSIGMWPYYYLVSISTRLKVAKTITLQWVRTQNKTLPNEI